MDRRDLRVAAWGLLAAAVAFGLAYRPSPPAMAPSPPGPGAAPPGAGPSPEPPRPAQAAIGPIVLRDVLARTGITFRHTDGGGGQRFIQEAMCAGMAVFDYNGDGLLDIYFVNGRPLRGTKAEGPPARNALYRNEGGWKFTDVTDEAGVDGKRFGLGVAVGDYDNDGWPDLFVNNFGQNVLYHNNGDGTFTDVTEKAGVGGPETIGAGANFLDVDGDGDLDLYVSNYVKFSYDYNPQVTVMGYAAYSGPYLFDKQPSLLYRNNGDGTFTDISAESGIGAADGAGMGTISADVNLDGHPDIIVNNDMAANFLFENDGSGKFKEMALLRGIAYDANGQAQSSMGVDCADYDNDGWPDLFMTSFATEMPALYRNLGGGTFLDVTLSAGALRDLYPHVNWGMGFIDFDNDGLRDLFVANGHLDENVHQYDQAAVYAARNMVFRNLGDGKFENVSDRAGDGLALEFSSRGAAFGDFDNDGRVDVVVLNSRREPSVLCNESPGAGHWLQISLRGVKSNREGIGALVRVVAGDLVQIDEVHSGRGYQGHWGTHLHFGLGQRGRVDRIEVRWPGGGAEVVENVDADQFLTIAEGRGVVKAGPKP